MSAFKQTGGIAAGLVFSGLVAGALGLAIANQEYRSEEKTTGSPESEILPGTGGAYGTGLGGSGQTDVAAAFTMPKGWRIRVCTEKTKADQISFKFSTPDAKSVKGSAGTVTPAGTAGASGTGTGGSSATDPAAAPAMPENTATWMRGEATEIKLPSELSEADKIKLEAIPAQKDKKASICVIYDDHVAKKLSFDDREVSTVKKTETGECGC